ncbi:MAG: radical SAM protein [Firmicutes bacterium]|nr:radical SAM protein [Bacillota bacterium]
MSIKDYNELVSPFVQTKVLIHNDKFEELKSDKVVSPITCEIDLTDGFCNNKCKHCFFGTNSKSIPIYMNTEVIKSVIKELHECNVRGIEFTGGGEPTTHPDIKEIIAYTLDLGFDVGIITNGLLLNKIMDVSDKLKFVRISIDAATPITYRKVHGVNSFNTVIENIRKLKDAAPKCSIGLGYLIVPDNVSDIVDASILAAELGVDYIQYRPASLTYDVKKEVWTEAEDNVKKAITLKINNLQIFNAGIKWHHVVEERKYSKCTTSSLVSVIKANGDIPLCVLKRNELASIIGNIYDGGFIKNWYGEKHYELIDNINLKQCRKPCKHDSYNIVNEAFNLDFYHKNFI